MMTIGQWLHSRRVDHFNLGLTHPRFRQSAAGPIDLKGFDADITAYPSTLNNWEKVSILGRIMQQARVYLAMPAATAPARYFGAVRDLYNSANDDMNLICGAGYQAMRNADLSSLRNPAPALGAKTVNVNVIYLFPMGPPPTAAQLAAVDARVMAQINAANNSAAFQRAALTVVRANANARVAQQTVAGLSILVPNIAGIPIHHQGTFSTEGSARDRLVEYCNAAGGFGINTIDLVCFDRCDVDGVQGYTIQNANRPIICLNLDPAVAVTAFYGLTVAHELGHAMTNCQHHSLEANELMAELIDRDGTDGLTDGQTVWLRHNRFT